MFQHTNTILGIVTTSNIDARQQRTTQSKQITTNKDTIKLFFLQFLVLSSFCCMEILYFLLEQVTKNKV